MNPVRARANVVDLFSGAGGMSFGFHRHGSFRVIAAADAQIGKPSTGTNLQCNATYALNIGIAPARIDLGAIAPQDLRRALGLSPSARVDVLSACPPCTGFSRAIPSNHLRDDGRNSLVRRCAEFAAVLQPSILVMENARELIRGNFSHHYRDLCRDLEALGYRVAGHSHVLTRFGLPQIRERALVIACKRTLRLRTLPELWQGRHIRADAITVRRAFAGIAPDATRATDYPGIASPRVLLRLKAIPKDGGSWIDLLAHPDADSLLTPAMRRIAAEGRFGSYPDVYGRMAWDKPAPTIKRECAHLGNGRYAHPEQDRLCSVREMAMLQGFPNDFLFADAALSNLYRHIGDAVPPLISYQIAHLCRWMLTERRPDLQQAMLPDGHLRRDDLCAASEAQAVATSGAAPECLNVASTPA
ncbi:MAG: DNA cytosine methyltransferase [Thiohalocapsa sp.]|nr:DNA cytosine methyltransferase [Thiohalocapsa sp.]MCF7989308.1 DNA cytosine methyltransferase [Thiohalocapsa sp.]